MSNTARPLSDDDSAAFLKAVEEGIADADAGRTVPYEDVRRWLLSWGTTTELPPPATGLNISPNVAVPA